MLGTSLPSVSTAGPARVVVHRVTPLPDTFSTTAGIIWSWRVMTSKVPDLAVSFLMCEGGENTAAELGFTSGGQPCPSWGSAL